MRPVLLANQADAMSKKRYSKARKKTHADKDELKRIDSIVSPLIRKGQPISHIYAEHGDEIGVSPRTLYRYIDMGCLKVNNFDLRRKVSYKQRKKKREESEAFQNQKFRQTRTYLDFVKYMEKHPQRMPGAGKADADAAVSQDESDADYADERRQGGDGCGTVRLSDKPCRGGKLPQNLSGYPD